MREDFAACVNSAVVQFTGFTGEAERLLEPLDDPEWRFVGRDMLDRLRAAQSGEFVLQQAGADDYAPPPAAFICFDDGAFANIIGYALNDKSGKPRSFLELFMSRVHECNHADVYGRAAILHTTPCNNAVVAVPCPEDFACMSERLEQDTAAKQAWIGALLAPRHPEIRDLMSRAPVSVRMFERMRAQPGATLASALAQAALVAMREEFDTSRGLNFADYYHGVALYVYERGLACLRANGLKPVIMRMEACDMADLGNTFGPNIFAGDARFARGPILNRANRNMVKRLHVKFGIGKRASLPSFGQALAVAGLDRAQFMARSKAWLPQSAERQSQEKPALALA